MRQAVEIVKEALEAWSRRDLDGLRECVSPTAEIDATRRALNPKTFSGWDGLALFFEEMAEAWEDLRLEAEEFTECDDSVVVSGRLKGRGRTSGIEVEQPFINLYRVRDGLIEGLTVGFPNEASAVQAAADR